MLSNLCCDPFLRLFFREFAVHPFASAHRHEQRAGSLGRPLIARPDVDHCGRDGSMAELLLDQRQIHVADD
jgi:hypothetical protein